jgi:hypothetical protein
MSATPELETAYDAPRIEVREPVLDPLIGALESGSPV